MSPGPSEFSKIIFPWINPFWCFMKALITNPFLQFSIKVKWSIYDYKILVILLAKQLKISLFT